MDVVVKHAFVAHGEGELGAKEGELVLLVEQSSSSEWWKVRNRDGDSGWIPSTYLSKLDNCASSTGNSVENTDTTHDNDAEICIAVHRFTATHADEISFKVGDAIEVLQKKNDGWWKGRVQGLDWTGWFPANYVEPKKKPRKKKVRREESTSSKSSVQSQSSSSGTVTDSDVDLISQLQGAESHSATEAPPHSTEQRLKALYPYTANNEDELSISENDVLYLLRSDETDLMLQQGWWQVMNGDGHIGLIPANYVESVSSTSNVPFRAVALHVYNSEGGEELSFLEGQVLDIIQSDSEWWYARDGETGTSGYVPSNYLRPLGEVERRDDPDKSNETGKDTASGDKEVESASASSSSSTERRSSSNKLRNSRRIPAGPFSQKDWYFGPMSRKECESIFTRIATAVDGDYLVRDGGKHALDFVLSVKSLERVRHFRVSMGEGTFSLVPTVKHKSMDELIGHYKKVHLFTEADGKKLVLKNILFGDT